MSEEENKKDTFSMKLRDLLFNWRILLLIFFIILSFFLINWNFGESGVVINGITPNSPATQGGMLYDADVNPRDMEKIFSVNDMPVDSVEEYHRLIEESEVNSTISLETDRGDYVIEVPDDWDEVTSEKLGISVREEPRSNIRLGMELEGGSKLILEPKEELSDEDFELLIETLQNRLDIYGASGTTVNSIEDVYSGERYIIVESISANVNDIYELISRQGEFEARIMNETVFTGNNVAHVSNDPQRTYLQGCSEGAEGVVCTYAFSVRLDSEGADNFYAVTSELDVVGDHLSEEVVFYMDGEKITSLSISSSFKYQRITQPQITVSGEPMPTRDEAVESARQERGYLQTILSTQSLPAELEVIQSHSVAPSRGAQLLENAVWVGIFAVLLVASIITIRYRQPLLFAGILTTLIAELIIIFGIAAFMRISIDLAAIGGLIAAIGTGVDDQIIITDEYMKKRKKKLTSRKRIKAALVIILIAYLTTLAAMIPLNFAGLQILQGFAFMIIIGVTIGVLITRPAYAAYLRIMTTTRQQRAQEKIIDEEEN